MLRLHGFLRLTQELTKHSEILPTGPIKRQDDSPVSRRSKIIICATFLAEAVFATIAKGSVWLSSFCALSRVPWSDDEIEGKVEKRARGLLACQVSECTSRCGFSPMENLSFSMTRPIRRDCVHFCLIGTWLGIRAIFIDYTTQHDFCSLHEDR